jgi:hypothetical protein
MQWKAPPKEVQMPMMQKKTVVVTNGVASPNRPHLQWLSRIQRLRP